MIKIHPQLLLIAELVLLYVVGGIISCKSPFKSFLEEISNCHLYFYYSPFLIFVSAPTCTYLDYDTLLGVKWEIKTEHNWFVPGTPDLLELIPVAVTHQYSCNLGVLHIISCGWGLNPGFFK